MKNLIVGLVFLILLLGLIKAMIGWFTFLCVAFVILGLVSSYTTGKFVIKVLRTLLKNY